MTLKTEYALEEERQKQINNIIDYFDLERNDHAHNVGLYEPTQRWPFGSFSLAVKVQNNIGIYFSNIEMLNGVPTYSFIGIGNLKQRYNRTLIAGQNRIIVLPEYYIYKEHIFDYLDREFYFKYISPMVCTVQDNKVCSPDFGHKVFQALGYKKG
jgi:hypothetical protein